MAVSGRSPGLKMAGSWLWRVGGWAGLVDWRVLLEKIGEMMRLDRAKRFAVVLHIFEGLNDGFGHSPMGFLGAADD